MARWRERIGEQIGPLDRREQIGATRIGGALVFETGEEGQLSRTVLDAAGLGRTLRRMALEVAERIPQEGRPLYLVGVRTGGAYLAQRRTLTAAETRVNVLAQANSQLNQQISKLQTDAEVERLARERYGLIKPGESPYVILPSPTPAPPATAEASVKKHPRSLPARKAACSWPLSSIER